MIERAGPERREELDTMLTSPLPGREERASVFQAEAEGASFMALYQQVNS